MIRAMVPEDIPAVGRIWLETSIVAHPFVPAEFWRADHATMVGEILPHPRTEGWVHVDGATGALDGFATLGGDTLACLFVRPDAQGRGIGSALLAHVQGLRARLSLTVYEQNAAARRFYEARGFRVTGRGTCPHTGCAELAMAWRAGGRPTAR